MIFPRVFAAGLLALALVAGCGQPAASLSVSIVPASPTAKAFVSVAGFSSSELSALSRASFSRDQWLTLIRVTVDGADTANPPVLGQHRVTSTTIDFIPMFPFDPGRGYAVEIDPTKLPTFAEASASANAPADRPAGTPALRSAKSFRTVVVIPALLRFPTVTVSRMLPTAAVLPENLLRIYLEFSGPMAREHGRDFLKLVEVNKDGNDVEVQDAFLALDVDFWSPDGRRYTVLLDPGRVKRGILPNDQVGRALKPGRRFALVVDPKWRDEHGQPMAAAFRHEFLVGPAEMTPVRLADWKVLQPSSSVQGPLLVRFPRSLDHGLLQRALGVQRDGQAIEGDIAIDANETEWRFTPKSAWTPGRYELVVLSILEDPMGNQIGRTFDVDKFTEIDKSASPDRMTIPFTVR